MECCALNDKIYKTLSSCQFKADTNEHRALECFIKKHIGGALYELYDFLEIHDIHYFSEQQQDLLVKKQIQHWNNLMLHNDFEDLPKESIRIGKAHDRNNISAEIYLLGYNKIISYLQRKLFEEQFQDLSLQQKLLSHITNRILMDISLSLSSYVSEREKNSLYFYDISKISSCNHDFKKAVSDILSLTIKRIDMQGICFYELQSGKFTKPLDTIRIGDDDLADNGLLTCRKEIINDFFLQNKDIKTLDQKPSFLTRKMLLKRSKELDDLFNKVERYILVPVRIEDELVGVVEIFSLKNKKEESVASLQDNRNVFVSTLYCSRAAPFIY